MAVVTDPHSSEALGAVSTQRRSMLSRANRPTHCMIISDYAERAGGAHSVAIDSAIALAQCGIPVTYIYGLGSVDPALASSMVQLIRGPALGWLDRLGLLFGWNGRVTEFLLRVSSMQKEPVDIVHIHGTTRYFGFTFVRALKRKGIKTVYSVHDYVPWCPVGTYYNHQKCQRCTCQPLSLNCITTHCDRSSYAHKLVRIFRHGTIARNLRMPWIDGWIFVSEIARATAQRLSPDKIDGPVVINPVRALPESPRTGTSERPLFVYLGRICPEKGIDRLLSVAAQVEADFELWGGMAVEPLPTNVRIFEHADRLRIVRALVRANALILLSEWDETFGLVVAEAASLGIPSIVSKYAGIASILPTGAGWVVDPFNETEVRRTLVEAGDRGESRRRGVLAGRWFSECLSMQPAGHASRLIEVYEKLQKAMGGLPS